MVYIIEVDAICRIAKDGRTVLECPVAFDPQAAIALLRQVNTLKDAKDQPIYDHYRAAQTPLWSMLQEHLFWEYLQPYIKYRPVIEWLAANPTEEVDTTIQGLIAWRKLLAHSDSATCPTSGLFQSCRHALEAVFLQINALLVGLISRFRNSNFLLWSFNCMWGNRWIDYRLKDVYGALWEHQVPFVEGFPFPGFKLILRRLIGSRRIAFYAPNFLRITPEAFTAAEHVNYDWSSIPTMPHGFLRPLIRWMELMMANVRLHTRLLGQLFRLAGIQRVIGIDDHTSFAALIATARTRGIETIGLQHGVFHKYSIGWTTPGIPHESSAGYDHILVWGDFWRELLCELGSTYRKEQLVCAGFIRPSTISLKPRSTPPGKGSLKILLPYEFLANPEEIAAFVNAFLARGYEVLFKVRFDDTLDEQLRMLPRERLQLVPELTQEILDSIHVCAGTSTTMMYELYCLGVPVWFIETKHDSNVHMVDKGLAARITLDLLNASNFEPFQYLISPTDPRRIFSQGGIPEYVLQICGRT